MQPKKKLWLIAIVGIIIVGAACKKDSTTPQDTSVRTRLSTYVEQDGKGIVYVTDLPGDTTANPGSPAQTIYFSFATNSTVDSSQRLTGNWDIAFSNIYNSYVTINNGANTNSPGYGNTIQGALYLVSQPFDSVKVVPESSTVNVNGSAGMDGYPSSNWPGWYQYNITTHILTTIQGKTLVIRLASGKYAKLEMGSLYKGSPTSPSLTTPVPYLSFRYWVQTDGSTNLAIP